MAIKIVHPRVLTNLEIDAMAARRTQADTEISRLCSGERHWTMRVPVGDDDSDRVLDNALRDSARLEREVYRLRGEIKTLLINHKADIGDDMHAKLMAIIYDKGQANAVS